MFRIALLDTALTVLAFLVLALLVAHIWMKVFDHYD